MRDIRKEVAEKFPQDVQNHTLSVELDNDLHRHLLFMRNGESAYHFHLTTWPGYLCISGDMGCYVFSRVRDMFKFFRTDKGRINPQYWQEKIQHGKDDVLRFSDAVFKDNIRQRLNDYLDGIEMDSTVLPEIWELIRVEIFNALDDGPQAAHTAARDFGFELDDHTYMPFQDFWEYDCREFTYHYLWCCHAITWGIQQYDALKQQHQEAADNAAPILPVS